MMNNKKITIINERGEIIARRKKNYVNDENTLFSIGQQTKDSAISKRYLLSDKMDLIEVNNVYNDTIDTIEGKIVIPNIIIRKEFMNYRTTKGFKNNLFLFVNDKSYVYVYHLTREEVRNNLEYLTTLRLENNTLMFKPKMNDLNLMPFKVYPIRYFEMMWDARLKELSNEEKDKLFNLLSKKAVNNGHYLEFLIGGDKNDILNIKSRLDKSFDAVPDNKYIDFTGYNELVNKGVKGVELKCCFDNRIALDFNGHNCNGYSTGHGYKIKSFEILTDKNR